MNEIKFYGRGGQGVVMASQMLGLAFFKAGMYPQCYSLFGGERRGAPVVSYIRVDREKILLKCDIKRPNEVIFFEPSLIDPEEVREMILPGGDILISTDRPVPDMDKFKGLNIGLIDASGIAQGLGLGHVINTTILGAYCRFTGHISMDHIISAVEEMVPAKKKINLEAVQRGYSELVLWNGGNDHVT
jgi:2-oxoacid:acceptor oxidoreductase gamma subunit (pyruvate/2-ketoisovalerate family)